MLEKSIIVIVFCFVYWFMCYLNTGTDKKNLLGFRSYPDKVKEKVKKDPILINDIPKDPTLIQIFVGNVLLFTIAFLIIGIVMKYTIGFDSNMECIIFFIILGETLNLFDLVIIDLLWWRNTERIRFTCVPNKEEYQDPTKHVNSFLRGIYTFIVVGVLVGCIISIL